MAELKLSVSERKVISSSKGYHWFPTVLESMKDGSIVLGYSIGADEHVKDMTDCMPHVLLKTYDNGWNWFLLNRNRLSAIGETLPCFVFENGIVYGSTHPLLKENGDMYCFAYRSEDNARTWQGPEESAVYFPGITFEEFKEVDSVTKWPKCQFEGNVIRGHEGELLRIADCMFRGDKCFSVCLINSKDNAKSWEYLSTIAGPGDEPAHFNESALLSLPGGELICVMRTDSHEEFKKGANPMYQSRSLDEGKTWSKPEYTGVWGVRPKLLQLRNGVLACSYGRVSGWPSLGDHIMFSLDKGQTWIKHTEIYNGPSTGYTSILEMKPNEILYVYDNLGFGWNLNNNIEMVTVKVEVL